MLVILNLYVLRAIDKYCLRFILRRQFVRVRQGKDIFARELEMRR